MHLVGGFLGHHVHVHLEYHSFAVLVAGGGGHADDHVAGLVGAGVDAALLGPFEDVFTCRLFVLGRPGAAGKSVEVVPDYGRLKVFDGHVFID